MTNAIKSLFRPSLLCILTLLGASAVVAQSSDLEIFPSGFDFGWCPEDAKVTAQFKIKNTTPQSIPITDVRPGCGCTASDFTPGDLSASDVMDVNLTFDTHGYGGRAFKKPAQVKTDLVTREYSVSLKGHVTNPDAKVLPDGSGLVEYRPDSKEKTKKVKILNKTKNEVSLSVVQKPASWAKFELENSKINAGGSTTLDLIVNPPYTDAKTTSLTFEATESTNTYRLTVAVQCGPPTVRGGKIKPAPKP